MICNNKVEFAMNTAIRPTTSGICRARITVIRVW